jgi:hypothetical protein
MDQMSVRKRLAAVLIALLALSGAAAPVVAAIDTSPDRWRTAAIDTSPDSPIRG